MRPLVQECKFRTGRANGSESRSQQQALLARP